MTGESRIDRWWTRLRLPVGVAAGSVTAAVELAFLVVTAVATAVSAPAPPAARGVTRLTQRYAG
ncbi:hypothetical protein [Micromonospora sp. DT231]